MYKYYASSCLIRECIDNHVRTLHMVQSPLKDFKLLKTQGVSLLLSGNEKYTGNGLIVNGFNVSDCVTL